MPQEDSWASGRPGGRGGRELGKPGGRSSVVSRGRGLLRKGQDAGREVTEDDVMSCKKVNKEAENTRYQERRREVMVLRRWRSELIWEKNGQGGEAVFTPQEMDIDLVQSEGDML